MMERDVYGWIDPPPSASLRYYTVASDPKRPPSDVEFIFISHLWSLYSEQAIVKFKEGVGCAWVQNSFNVGAHFDWDGKIVSWRGVKVASLTWKDILPPLCTPETPCCDWCRDFKYPPRLDSMPDLDPIHLATGLELDVLGEKRRVGETDEAYRWRILGRPLIVWPNTNDILDEMGQSVFGGGGPVDPPPTPRDWWPDALMVLLVASLVLNIALCALWPR